MDMQMFKFRALVWKGKITVQCLYMHKYISFYWNQAKGWNELLIFILEKYTKKNYMPS